MPGVPLMFIIYNKRAIFDDNLLDNIRLFQKVNIRHFISITSGKRPRFTINQIVWCSSSHSKNIFEKLNMDFSNIVIFIKFNYFASVYNKMGETKASTIFN